MRYGRQHEPQARLAYEQYLQKKDPQAKVDITGVHIDVANSWLAASPDGLVTDPTAVDPEGLRISYCPHTRVITDINDRGKVGCPSYGRGRSPRLYEGNRLSLGH